MSPERDVCEPEALHEDSLNATAGFKSFLVAIGGDDVGATVCDDVSPSNAQKHPSQPFQSDTDYNEPNMSLSEGIGMPELPVAADAVHEPAASSAVPRSGHTRLERTREKNRRAQKAFRRRQKLLNWLSSSWSKPETDGDV